MSYECPRENYSLSAPATATATATAPAASAEAAATSSPEAASAIAGRTSRLVAPRLPATVIPAEPTGTGILSLILSASPASRFVSVPFEWLRRRAWAVVYIAR